MAPAALRDPGPQDRRTFGRERRASDLFLTPVETNVIKQFERSDFEKRVDAAYHVLTLEKRSRYFQNRAVSIRHSCIEELADKLLGHVVCPSGTLGKTPDEGQRLLGELVIGDDTIDDVPALELLG